MRAEVKFNAASSCACAAEVHASNIVSLRVRSFNESPSKGSKPAKCDNTFDTGHIEHNFGCGGRTNIILVVEVGGCGGHDQNAKLNKLSEL